MARAKTYEKMQAHPTYADKHTLFNLLSKKEQKHELLQ